MIVGISISFRLKILGKFKSYPIIIPIKFIEKFQLTHFPKKFLHFGIILQPTMVIWLPTYESCHHGDENFPTLYFQL